jgi:NAD(P)-dependent dehydrogenase (short-subunit alcohol dehydrogenase family)
MLEEKQLNLKDKVAIITGAGNGIGRGIAVAMAKEGAAIVIADRNVEFANKTAELLAPITSKYLVFKFELTDLDQHAGLVEEALKKFGKIDILVNNAGIFPNEDGLLNIKKEDMLNVLFCDLIGPMFLTQRVARVMIEKRCSGSILFTSSVHGQVTALRPTYCVAKAGIDMLVKETALELAKYSIRVNAVAPGYVAVRGETKLDNLHVPLGYSATPEDVANVMAFLADEKSNYITGQTIVVDGGFSITHVRYWINKGLLPKVDVTETSSQ